MTMRYSPALPTLFLLGMLMGAVEPSGAGDAATQSANLPASKDKAWDLLRHSKVELDFKQGTYVATHPADVQAMNGKEMEIVGYVTPVKSEFAFHHFLLMPYAPGCAFCPPPDFNEIVEVESTSDIRAGTGLFRVRGIFSTQNNGKDGLFFRIDKADVEMQ